MLHGRRLLLTPAVSKKPAEPESFEFDAYHDYVDMTTNWTLNIPSKFINILMPELHMQVHMGTMPLNPFDPVEAAQIPPALATTKVEPTVVGGWHTSPFQIRASGSVTRPNLDVMEQLQGVRVPSRPTFFFVLTHGAHTTLTPHGPRTSRPFARFSPNPRVTRLSSLPGRRVERTQPATPNDS